MKVRNSGEYDPESFPVYNLSISGEPVNGKKLAFIPTASLVEKVRFYVDDDRKAFEKLGLIIEELEISTATTEEIAQALERNDYIFISG